MMIADEAVEAAEVQAILALCHHAPMNHECPSCQFRAAAGVEHIVAACKEAIESMKGLE
jgi:hypothetical protein